MMDGMNFLNKKYTSVHNTTSLAQSRSRSSRTFIPSPPLAATLHHNPSHAHIPISSLAQQQPVPANTHIASNHCPIHSQQLIRHLCLDCIQLLCSECISEHISVHRENNSFPNIHTLKQVRTDMNLKLEEIVGYMFKEKNHPKNMASTVDAIRKESAQKIDNLRKDLIEFVQQWILRLKTSIMNNVGYEQIRLIQQEMYSLHEQVNQLINSLTVNNVSVHDIKKAYQIDADRLQKCYKEKMEKYLALSEAMRVDIDLDSGKFIEGLEAAIALRIGGKGRTEIIRVDDINNHNHSSIIEEGDQVLNLPLQKPSKPNSKPTDNGVPLLYSLVSGTDTLKILNPAAPKADPVCYQLEGAICYPLSSVCLLSDGMVVISGGMIAENKKSDLVQVFDYEQGKLVSDYRLTRGRSSHRTVVNGDQILLIGGFTSENQECRDVEIITVDGVKMCENKCKWGGPNLSIKTGSQILKVTVSGVQVLHLESLQWQQITTQVPFALSKGMQICLHSTAENPQQIVVFGDDQFFYKWHPQKHTFHKMHSNLNRPVISACCHDNIIYGWVQDSNSRSALVRMQGDKWVGVQGGAMGL